MLDKFNELENQEIYFASQEELNDPMEGYKDLFWKGDVIVWKNFLLNYIRSAENTFGQTILLNEKEKLTEVNIFPAPIREAYKTPEYKSMIQQIIDNVFSYEFIKDFSSAMAGRTSPIRRVELLSYLELLHPFVMSSISKSYHERRFIEKDIFSIGLPNYDTLLKDGGFVGLVNRMEKENSKHKNLTENLFQITSMVNQQVKLLTKYNQSGKLNSNISFLISEFPENYILKLESLIYPDWYSASFLLDISNSAIWGHYGDNHRGVCLKFKTIKNAENFELHLNTVYGHNGSGLVVGMRPHAFRQINYHNKHVEIDFFRSIGRMSKIELKALWYSDEAGNLSSCGDHLNNEEPSWREAYWKNFYDSFSVKLSEWSYEKEYRLVIDGGFTDYKHSSNRKLKYGFNDLEGIIFGMKTSTLDKIKIMKIIESKCKKNKRKEFNFYQAYYSKDSGKVENFKLNLLKFH